MTKGNGVARVDRSVRRWLVAPVRARSEKPHELHALIERLSGPQRRVDVFAGSRRTGWDALGDEIDGLDITDAMQSVVTPVVPVSPWFGRVAVPVAIAVPVAVAVAVPVAVPVAGFLHRRQPPQIPMKGAPDDR